MNSRSLSHVVGAEHGELGLLLLLYVCGSVLCFGCSSFESRRGCASGVGDVRGGCRVPLNIRDTLNITRRGAN